MHVFIVYAHPSKDSFTYTAKEQFIKGLKSVGHTFEESDLYAMNFNPVLSEGEYIREAFYHEDAPVANDVAAEHEKIDRADVVAFFYPVFWTDAPAILKGWFDRVWTLGYAYDKVTMGPAGMVVPQRAICVASIGNTAEGLATYGIDKMLETIMLGDRIGERATEKDFVLLTGTARNNMALREANSEASLKKCYDLGASL